MKVKCKRELIDSILDLVLSRLDVCPMCGGAPRLVGRDKKHGVCAVMCSVCGTEGPELFAVDAMRAWNRRKDGVA